MALFYNYLYIYISTSDVKNGFYLSVPCHRKYAVFFSTIPFLKSQNNYYFYTVLNVLFTLILT